MSSSETLECTPCAKHIMGGWQQSSQPHHHPYERIDHPESDNSEAMEETLEEIDLSEQAARASPSNTTNASYVHLSTYAQPEIHKRPSVGKFAPKTKDGVFFNMSAKPGADPISYSKVHEGDRADPTWEGLPLERPPEYDSVAELCPPAYNETIHLSEDITSIIIDGLYVGSWYTFGLCCLTSFLFELIGFAISFLLIDSVAGKCGGLTGLGMNIIVTVLYPGFFGRKRQPKHPQHPQHPPNDFRTHPSPQAAQVGVIIGLMAVTLSTLYYYRVRRLAARQLEQDYNDSTSNTSV